MWEFLNINFLQGGVVSTSPNPQAGGPPLVGYPRLLIQFTRSYPPYRRPFLYPQPEDAPCRSDRVPLHIRMRWAGHVTRMGEERGVYRVLVGKPEGKRPLGRPRHRWADNIRMDLQEAGCGYMDWFGLAQDRDRWRTLVSAVMNLRVPWMRGISWLAANQLASQEGLCTTE